MSVDTADLRARSKIIATGLPRTAKAMVDAAEEIDALRAALAAVPHAELCSLLMTRDGEPCSCEKSATTTALEQPLMLIPDQASVSYLGVTRLTVAGPHGPVIGLPRVGAVHVDVTDQHLTVTYDNPGRTP